METTRRGLFGMILAIPLAGAGALGLVKKKKTAAEIWEEMLNYLFSFGSNEKVMFVHPTQLEKMKAVIAEDFGEKMERSFLEPHNYGLQIEKLETPFGSMNLIKNRFLKKDQFFLLDTKNLSL